MEPGNDQQKEVLYNQWHATQAGYFSHATLFPWHEAVLSRLPEKFEGSILEIGCGSGDFSILLAKRFPEARITGTDFSGAAIASATSKLSADSGNVAFQTENAEKLSFEDNSFDLVISCETIEHVFNPQIMVSEMFRVLKPGGRVLLTTENYFNGLILSWLQTWLFKRPFNSGSGVQPHENFMIFYITGKWFKKAGFNSLETFSSHYQWLLLPGVAPKKLCTRKFESGFLRAVFKPFGRHFTYQATKPI